MNSKLDISLIKEISFTHELDLKTTNFGVIKLINVDEFISGFDERLKGKYFNISTILISVIYWLMSLLICLSLLNFKLYIISLILFICFSIFYLVLLFATRTYLECYDVNVYALLLEVLNNKDKNLDITFSRDTINSYGRGWSDVKYLATLYLKNIDVDFDVDLDSTLKDSIIYLDLLNNRMKINENTYSTFNIRDIHHV